MKTAMNIIPTQKTIHILEGDPALSHSLKCLLEAPDRLVRVFDDRDDFFSKDVHQENDVVILNFAHHSTQGFEILNLLLNSAKRPEILITSSEQSVFERGDRFSGERVTIMFHPFTPAELMNTIELLW